MRSGSFYDKLAELSNHMYQNPTKDFKDWKFIDSFTDNTGLYVSLFDTGKEIIFSVKGTDIFKGNGIKVDFKADISLFKNEIPSQIDSADKYYQTISEKYSNIIFTGYSLGGSIVQALGTRYGKETVTFEAFAVGSFEKAQNTSNIINFGSLLDPIFKADLSNHIGDVYAIPSIMDNKTMGNLFKHTYFFFGKPSTAKKIDKNIDIRSIYKDTKAIENTAKYIKQGITAKADYINKSAKELTQKTYNKLMKK